MRQIKIAILGLGTVGSAVAEAVHKNARLIAAKTGIALKVEAGCDVRKIKAAFPVTGDPYKIINDPAISIIVETIGGVNPARRLVLAALKAGKYVVTSNKELIARHGEEILKTAEQNGVAVLFEGSVGGGIPILAALRDNLAANQISEIYGIVNGTTNFILSHMTAEGKELSPVLKEAQRLGFAEADPRSDIEGYDAVYKAVILAATAFGCRPKVEAVFREGIEKITQEDIQYAEEIGYVIKLLAIARRKGDRLEVRVHPALVAKDHPLAGVHENFNAIYVKGEPVGELMFYGPGAGGKATASAVMADVISLADGKAIRHYTSNHLRLEKMEEVESRYYLRLQAPDRYGVLAGIARAFAEKKVSIAAVMQKETIGNISTIVILVHKVKEKNLRAALKKIKGRSIVYQVSNVIRII